MIFALLAQKVRIKRTSYKANNDNKNVVISAFFVLFVLLLSLRGQYCGNDTLGYITFFEQAGYLSWDALLLSDLEVAYLVLEKLCAYLFTSPQIFLTVVACISVVPIWMMYRKYSMMPLLVISLFLTVAPFTMYFSGLRQIIAMAFIYPAFEAAKRRRLIVFLLITAIAFLFHKSAFIMLLMYPVCRFKITFKWLWFVVPVIVLIFVFNTQIFGFLLFYLNDIYDGTIVSTGAYTILILLILFTAYCFIIPDETKLDSDTLMMRNILLLSVVIQCFAPLNPLSMRLNYYFLLFVPLLIPRIASNPLPLFQDTAAVSHKIMVVFFYIYFFANLVSGGGLNIYPYTSFWA